MIRKRLLIALSMTVLLLMGCSKETVPSEPESTENDETVDAVTEVPDETENMEIAEVEEAEVAETVKPKYITIDFNGVTETHAEGDSVTPLKWNILSEEDNGIDFADEWYASENLSLPMIGTDWNSFSDENYEYLWEGEDLYIYENGTGNCLYVLHYPTDKWYVNGNNAYLKDGIFYGASVANGYAQPNTCFMFAYDLENEKLLWRSADQSYNSMNFVVEGDVLICGYGFTAEPDYLYQINRNTGEIIDRLLLKKMPDLIVEQDGKLYVHTYSYNYVIEIE
ncbi:hypothetical protein KFE18_07055 [Clostridiaceae bacterium Marseille-Q4143]|nr:hypothetical protein KFE18_07055 [Clostridiaceae bacterium Marseille-Q4143]